MTRDAVFLFGAAALLEVKLVFLKVANRDIEHRSQPRVVAGG